MNKKLLSIWDTKTKDDEWWSSFVTSPIAVLLNYIVIDYKWLTPNIITLLSFIVAIIAVCFILIGWSINFIIAAILIHMSHILDCMDGQMARYRGESSLSGSYFDKLTDQVQVITWFMAIGYVGYTQSASVLPVFLAFIGVSFYSLRWYTKYVTIFTEMNNNKSYLWAKSTVKKERFRAWLGFSFKENLLWLIKEQKKILSFDEWVFIFMLSFALVFNVIEPMLWIFAMSQLFYWLYRAIQRWYQIHTKVHPKVWGVSDK
jgi:phosphatidylglycerophosphate synthase